MSQGPPRVYTFFVLKHPGEPDRVVVWDTQDVTVGRSPENDLTLDHGELSRRHAVFLRMGRACVVRNLSTSNGTFVNGRPIENHSLAPGDVVQMADLEFHFHEEARNPVTLGAKLVYSSQLKGFPGGADGGHPESTMLGLLEAVDAGDDEDFEVRPASEFAYDLHGMDELGEAPAPRNLDLELEALEAPARDAAPRPARSAPPGGGRLSLRLEVEGLDSGPRRWLESLCGRTLTLQGLRIRIESDADATSDRVL
jgi:hypothetical protein